jgi:hypothetical protein
VAHGFRHLAGPAQARRDEARLRDDAFDMVLSALPRLLILAVGNGMDSRRRAAATDAGDRHDLEQAQHFVEQSAFIALRTPVARRAAMVTHDVLGFRTAI